MSHISRLCHRNRYACVVLIATALLATITGCGLTQAGAGSDTATSSASATSAAANATAAAGGPAFRIHQGGGWSPLSIGIPLHGTVTWQNFDTTSAHPVECAPLIPGHDPCPWSGTLTLPPALYDTTGAIVPSAISLRIDKPGIYYFRDALNHADFGEIACGAPGTPPGSL